MKLLNLLFLVLLITTLISCEALSDYGSNEMMIVFDELDWDREDYKNAVLINDVELNFSFNTTIYVYIKFPDITQVSGNRTLSFFEISIRPYYKTTCPENFISKCKEYYHEMGYFYHNTLTKSFEDLKEGGFVRFSLETHNTYRDHTVDATYKYTLTHFTIQLTQKFSYYLIRKQDVIDIYDLTIQEGAILFSNKNYSDSEIVSAFEKKN